CAVFGFPAMLSGKTKKAMRRATGHLKHAVLDHGRGHSKLARELGDDPEEGCRMALQRCEHVAAIKEDALDGIQRNGIGRSAATVECRHLTDQIAGPEKIEHDLARVIRDVRDFDAAAHDDDHAFSVIATPIERITPRKANGPPPR